MKKLILLMLLTTVANASIESVVKDSQPKVVKIGIVLNDGIGVCSGAFLNETGLTLTCAHCFNHGTVKKLFVKTDAGVAYPAVLLFKDDKRDLAIIEPLTSDIFPFFRLGKEPHIGQMVIAFGSPLGIQHTITVGYVSNLINQVKILIFHSAFLSPGNSGGPLVNLDGELVGVNELVTGYGFAQVAQGLYGSISVTEVRNWFKEFRKKP